jgi:hypothetical protein
MEDDDKDDKRQEEDPFGNPRDLTGYNFSFEDSRFENLDENAKKRYRKFRETFTLELRSLLRTKDDDTEDVYNETNYQVFHILLNLFEEDLYLFNPIELAVTCKILFYIPTEINDGIKLIFKSYLSDISDLNEFSERLYNTSNDYNKFVVITYMTKIFNKIKSKTMVMPEIWF